MYVCTRLDYYRQFFFESMLEKEAGTGTLLIPLYPRSDSVGFV